MNEEQLNYENQLLT